MHKGSLPEPTYLWYDVKKDKLIEWWGSIGYVAMMLSRGDRYPSNIARVEISKDLQGGRLIGSDGSICEFIGEI